MEKFLEMMGYRYRDKVTDYVGIAESVSFDLYGCVQVALRPKGEDKDGKLKEGRWFDVTRLKKDGDPNDRVMDLPDYSHLMKSSEIEIPGFNQPGSGPADKSQIRSSRP